MPLNTDVIRASYEAFARGDVAAATAAFAPDIEWTHPDGMSDYGLGGTKKGHDEVRAFMARARTVFSELRPEPTEFLADGERVVVFGQHHMRGARSGVTGTVPFVHSWRMRDGEATHFEDLHDTAEVRRIVQPEADVEDWRDYILQTGLGFWRAKALLSAVELGVFTALGDADLTAEELRGTLALHGRAVVDLLDTLVSLGLLEREAGRYRNTTASAMFLNRASPKTYLGGLLEVANQQWYSVWGNLETALRTGEPQDNTGEGDPFEALYSDPGRVRAFQAAMAAGSLVASTALTERFAWSDVRTVADVGCAAGAVLARLLSRHPHLTGLGFDLPPLAGAFASTAREYGVEDRMSFIPGSFFTDDLPGAEVIVLGHVLHDWDLDTKQLLLAKAFAALPAGGQLVIYETLIDDERRRRTFGMLMSLHMLLQSPGGFDYTAADCLTWLSGAGFVDCRVERLSGPEYLVLASKPAASNSPQGGGR